MTEAWDALVGWAQHSRAAGRSSMTAEVAAIMQGQAEIERLRRELAELKAAAPSRSDRDRLAANLRLEADHWSRRGETLEAALLMDAAKAVAIPPAAPAAIVWNGQLRECCGFERAEDAQHFYDTHDHRGQWVHMFTFDRWCWHPAAPGESGEAADG